MARNAKGEYNVFSQSFIDVFANTLGGLAFILIIVILLMGIRFARPVINTEKLPNAYVGVPYEVWLSAAEGGGVYNWKIIDGELPEGLELTDPGTGHINGIPQFSEQKNTGDYRITMQVDAGQIDTGFVSVRQYTLQLNDSPYGSLKIVTGDTLPVALKDKEYPLTFAATGGKPPYRWTLESSQVNGINLDNINGLIRGNVINNQGNYELIVRINDSFNNSVTKKFFMKVIDNPEPCIHSSIEIITDTLADALKGKKYTIAFAAEGGYHPYSWEINHTVPGLSTTSDGSLFGKPERIGDYSINATVTDAKGQRSAIKRLNLEVLLSPKEDIEPLNIISDSKLPDLSSGKSCNWALSAMGGVEPYTWKLESEETIPIDIKLSEKGILTGSVNQHGEYSFTIELSDSEGDHITKAFTLNVLPVIPDLQIETTDLPYAVKGFEYHCMLAASGGYPPYSWSTESELPEGLSFKDGVLTGNLREPWSGSIMIRCEDQTGSEATKQFNLEALESGQGSIAKRLEIKTRQIPTLIVGYDYEIPISIEGGISPYHWDIQGNLTSGLAFEQGIFKGKISSSESDSVLAVIKDSSGQEISQNYLILSERKIDAWWRDVAYLIFGLGALALIWSLLVLRKLNKARKVPLEVATREIPNARCSFDYKCYLSAIGGVPPFKWSLIEGELPDGLTLTEDGLISGVPLKGIKLNDVKEFTFTVKVTDSVGNTATHKL
jgi:large repetitive protein